LRDRIDVVLLGTRAGQRQEIIERAPDQVPQKVR
jgi:hypothetical protein